MLEYDYKNREVLLVGLMNWLMKGIGFEDEEDQETDAIKIERKIQKQKLKEAKRKEQEAKKLERTNKRLEKMKRPEAVQTSMDIGRKNSYMQNPDQFNFSSNGYSDSSDNYGGYGTDYTPVNGNMGGYGSKNVVFFYPKSYDEVQRLIDYLKQGESVMLNLDNITDAEAQRMLDFASGSVYALNGSIQRVSGNIFLLTPEGLNIMVPNKR